MSSQTCTMIDKRFERGLTIPPISFLQETLEGNVDVRGLVKIFKLICSVVKLRWFSRDKIYITNEIRHNWNERKSKSGPCFSSRNQIICKK